MPTQRKRAAPEISPKVREICAKLQADPTGNTLTRTERKLEVTRKEAAYLLSMRAGRTIAPDYLRQLIFGETPRLVPSRPVGNSYLYTVESLLGVRFTRPHKKSDGTSSEQH